MRVTQLLICACYIWTRRIKRRLDICNMMTSLEALLAKGPSGDAEAGLEQLRYTILSDGIPSNSDGMVRWSAVNKALKMPNKLPF